MIIKLRIMAAEAKDVERFAELAGAIPEVTETDDLTIKENYRSGGFRGYLRSP